MHTFRRLALLFAAFIPLAILRAQSNYATPYAFTTLAGSAGSSGSTNGPGSAALFNFPAGLATDSQGNVYVADAGNNVIRKIAPGGVVTTLVGTAGGGGSADGTGSAAQFWNPTGVAVDALGNVYVTDTQNHTVRKIASGGVVTTLAGLAGASGSADGIGSAARFSNLYAGVAVDSGGNVYVADTTNGTIRKITAGGVVTTFAGTAGNGGSADGVGSAAQFFKPYGLAIDASGNLYVADAGNNTIRKITPGGAVTTLAGTAGSSGSTDGTGTAALFWFPTGVAVDGAGNVYVADANVAIRKITPGGVVTTLAGTAGSKGPTDGTGSAARFYLPYGVAVDGSGNLYVSDNNYDTGTGAGTIRKGSLAPVPVITSALTATGSFGTAFNYTVTTGSSPTSFTATGLPAGLSIDASTGVISGTPTIAGTYTIVISATGASGTAVATLVIVVSTSAPTARLVNLSARASVGTGGNILIAGFVVSGSGNKTMLVRGVGPALNPFGIANYLTQPLLGLFNSQSVMFNSNAGWGNNAALVADFNQAGAFAYSVGSLDSALQVSLPANQSYTVQVSGMNSGTGVALAELYDADPGVLSSASRLINISARANVGAGANILIAGFVIGGSGTETVLIRGVGPALAGFGLTGVLLNPVLTLYDAQGNVITSNQGWQNSPAAPAGIWAGQASLATATHAAFTAAGAFDLGNGTNDSAFIVTLPAGAYTAQLAGANSTAGIALVEVYEVK